MKRKTLTLFLFACVASVGALQAQDYAFKVLANKGGNEVKSGGAWQPIKTGASLKAGDEIKVAANAYLGLVHVTGKPLELKEANTYDVTQLSTKIGSGSTSVVTKYTDFILSSNNTPESKKARLGATGAVDRGEHAELTLVLPESQHAAVYNNKAFITWEGSKVSGPFVLVVKNMFDDEIARLETPETNYTLDLADPKFEKENALILQVVSKVNPKDISKTRIIKKLSSVEHSNIKKSLDVIMNDVGESTALNKMILAGFYEENKLLIDAITAYEEAIKLAPDVPEYKEAFEEFLFRNNISQ
jgi:hypothetical protein